MIDIPFDPDLVIGSFRVSWHSLFALVGMIVGSTVSFRCARYLVKDERVYLFAIAVVVGGIAGARIAHIADNPAAYGGDVVKMLDLSRGGIGTMGAPIGSTVAGLIAGRWLRLPLGFMFDISVVGISLGEAIGRIGDIINGEHHAIACEGLPWCVRYTSPATLGQATPVHPIGLYDALLMLGVFVVLSAYWRRVRGRPPESRVYWAYLLLLGGGRLLQGLVRVEPTIAFGWTEAQILGGLYVLASAVMLAVLGRRARVRMASENPLHKGVSGR
ncbi:MAG TPA: prolipoprotein diacylglyceryl transferase family protein [Candidatus Limnocylindria bacterium]|nr:prolipoprotein diacylglyceryl transferase family protein [Candidatus Limnocylindria bacterium]